MQFLVGFRERSPGYEGSTDDLFIAGDLAVRRYRYSYAEPLPDRGSFQCGVILYRFEDHRIAEYWNIYQRRGLGLKSCCAVNEESDD